MPMGPHDVELSIHDASDKTQAKVWFGQGSDSVNRSAGILFVTGVDGGFIQPVDGIYDRLAERFAKKGVSSVFVTYRQPGMIDPSVEDALSAADLLRGMGVKRLAIVGWSFGGAVISHSATLIPEAVTAVGFAPQSRETEPVAFFTDRQSMLLFHSRADENVPYEASEQILAELPEAVQRELHLYDDADHYLSGMEGIIDPIAESWLIEKLALRD